MARTVVSSEFVKDQRLEYALYLLSDRSIPTIADGLINASRRNLWKIRGFKKVKVETLAGATMSIHPHGTTSDVVNKMAAFYGNNVPLLTGYGAFGTRLDRTAYGAPRYTSVSLSEFANDVVMCDLDLVELTDNYDHSEKEPKHFLPLIPIILLNPSDGIAVGYKSRFVPRALDDIIESQIEYLKTGKITSDLIPTFTPYNSKASTSKPTPKGTTYYFEGRINRISKTQIHIDYLAYGINHADVIKTLDDLWDSGVIHSYIDNSAKDVDITVKLPKGKASDISDEKLIEMFGLNSNESEIPYLLNFDCTKVQKLTSKEIVETFTEWRLSWFNPRYEKLKEQETKDLTKLYDIRLAIQNNIGSIAPKIQNRAELKELLQELGIVNLDYISDLPVYRFTELEFKKNEDKIVESEQLIKFYDSLLTSPEKMKKIYINELQEILTKYRKGKYTT